MKIKRLFKSNLAVKIISCFLAKIIKIVCLTIRLKTINEEVYLRLKKEEKRLIYTTWHNRLFLIPYFLRKKDLQILVSKSRDGRLLSSTLKYFNLYPIEGSTHRGGAEATIKMIHILKKGFEGGITPDGPQGPKYFLKRGVIDIAQKTGHTILPITYGVSKKYTLHTWDNFIIPCPFAKGVLIYGEPIEVGKDLSRHQIEEIRLKAEIELSKITTWADKEYSFHES
ncbi:MAG: lysophospholipid acyltransferase family protein [bacterium]|nr:lysophospholipid acyltransferase family protein [bacterium]